MISLNLLSATLAQVTKPWEDLTYDRLPLPNSGPGAATFKALEVIFSNILSVIMALAGFAAFIMLLLGGFRYLTSGGDPKATAQAKGTLTWAIMGLLLLIGAWFILRFIYEFTGAQVTHFEIPGKGEGPASSVYLPVILKP